MWLAVTLKAEFKTVCLVLSSASAPVCRPVWVELWHLYLLCSSFLPDGSAFICIFSMYYNIVELTNKVFFCQLISQTDLMQNINILKNNKKSNTSQRFFFVILAEIMLLLLLYPVICHFHRRLYFSPLYCFIANVRTHGWFCGVEDAVKILQHDIKG